MKEDLDVHGRRTVRPDGWMDPEAFGLGRKAVTEAVAVGARLLVLRVLEVKGNRGEAQDVRFKILEDLSGGGGTEEEDIWVHFSKEYKVADAARPAKAPYHKARATRGNAEVHLLRPRKEDSALPIAAMSPIGPDDAVIREMRSWFER
jgi:hypothetical protein